VIREVGHLVLGMGLPPKVLAQLLNDMSTVEWRLAAGCNDKVTAKNNTRAVCSKGMPYAAEFLQVHMYA